MMQTTKLAGRSCQAVCHPGHINRGVNLCHSRIRQNVFSSHSNVPARSPPPVHKSGPKPTSLKALSPQQELITTSPVSQYDVDKDLWDVLDLCTDEELELVYDALYSTSPFSPVIKTLMAEQEPALVSLRGRTSVMHKVESRFRLLAADSTAFLRGKRPAYREALLSIRDRLDVKCSSNLSTTDLEMEIFLHTMNNCMEYVQTGEDPDPQEAAEAAHMNFEQSHIDPASQSRRSRSKATNWAERLTAPVKFGVKDMVPTLAKLGSVVAVSAVGQRAAAQLGTQLVCSQLRYQAAVRAATSMLGSGMWATWQRQAALQAAQQGVVAATARYSALRGFMSFLGPLTWGWLAVDLGLKAVGTDYARIIRAVYVLAQVRLVRTYGWCGSEASGLPTVKPPTGEQSPAEPQA